MSFEVSFEERAISQAVGILADDPDGVQALLDTIDALADEPGPAASSPFGSPDLRRLGAGGYRVVYEIRADAIVVGHIGRAPL